MVVEKGKIYYFNPTSQPYMVDAVDGVNKENDQKMVRYHRHEWGEQGEMYRSHESFLKWFRDEIYIVQTKADTAVLWFTQRLDVKEATGRNDGAEVELITGGHRHPWCAEAVCRAYQAANLKLVGYVEPNAKKGVYNPLANCDALVEEMKKYQQFLPPTAVPQRGDMIFFGTRGDSDSGGSGDAKHVGIVERVDGTQIHTVEGNTSDRIARRSYEHGIKRIIGYGRHREAQNPLHG